MMPPTFNSLSVWCLENPDSPRKVGIVSLASGMKRLSGQDIEYLAQYIDAPEKIAMRDRTITDALPAA